MSRPIKFRAWNIITKTMIDLKKITPLVLNMDTDGLFIPFSDGLPLMQFTGLRDKNGKEIYEGDIVTQRMKGLYDGYYTIIGDVIFLNGYFMLSQEKNNGAIMVWHNTTTEVIGNIFESPELLEAV